LLACLQRLDASGTFPNSLRIAGGHLVSGESLYVSSTNSVRLPSASAQEAGSRTEAVLVWQLAAAAGETAIVPFLPTKGYAILCFRMSLCQSRLPPDPVLATLTPREERVLRMRFGIGLNTDHTLEQVGRQFSLTRERIRQIEGKALSKLKHPSRSGKARSFLDR